MNSDCKSYLFAIKGFELLQLIIYYSYKMALNDRQTFSLFCWNCRIWRISHEWSFHMKFMKLAWAFGEFHKFHTKWPLVWDPVYHITLSKGDLLSSKWPLFHYFEIKKRIVDMHVVSDVTDMRQSVITRVVMGFYEYSRTSMARTLMARLPGLFRTRFWVPWKKFHSCRFGIIWGDFLSSIENGMLCVLVRIASMRRLYENTQRTFMSILSLLIWRYNQPSLVRTTPVSN